MDKVVHFEIPFDNKTRAMKFYSEMFGWKLTDMQQMDYVMAESIAVDKNQMPREPGAINGGLFQRPKEAPNPVIYVGVSSIEQTLKKLEGAGGRIVTPKTAITGMGAYARIADTEGNIVGLFQQGGQ
jgi:predicted enzyme related to lactoylglutathione lyase